MSGAPHSSTQKEPDVVTRKYHKSSDGLADLKRSGLNERDAKRMRLEFLTAQQVSGLTDGKYKSRATKFPYLDVNGGDTGFFRLRFLDDVREFGKKKAICYWQPKETAPQIYLAPGIDLDQGSH